MGLRMPIGRSRVLPGLGLSLGITWFYLGLIVLIPLGALFLQAASLRAADLWRAVSAPRGLAAFPLSIGAPLSAPPRPARPADLWRAVSAPRALAASRLSFGASIGAGLVNAVFGFLVAWVLARYRFPGRQIVDALVDLPFALPTAVAGLALTALYAPDGWFGRFLEPLGGRVVFHPLGL